MAHMSSQQDILRATQRPGKEAENAVYLKVSATFAQAFAPRIFGCDKKGDGGLSCATRVSRSRDLRKHTITSCLERVKDVSNATRDQHLARGT